MRRAGRCVQGLATVIVLFALAGCGAGPGAESIPTAPPAQQTAPASAGSPGTPGDAASGGWQTVTSADGSFTVELPGTPSESQSTQTTSLGDLTVHSMSYSSDGPEYIVTYTDFPSTVADTDAAELLKSTIEGAAQGNSITGQKSIDVQGNPGIQGEFELQGTHYAWYKAVLVGPRQYQLVVATSSDTREEVTGQARRFMDSFRLNK